MFDGEDEKDEVGIRDEDGARGGVDNKGVAKKGVDSKNVTSAKTIYLH